MAADGVGDQTAIVRRQVMNAMLKKSGFAAAMLLLPMLPYGAQANMTGAKVFDTPQMAVEALIEASRNNDRAGQNHQSVFG